MTNAVVLKIVQDVGQLFQSLSAEVQRLHDCLVTDQGIAERLTALENRLHQVENVLNELRDPPPPRHRLRLWL